MPENKLPLSKHDFSPSYPAQNVISAFTPIFQPQTISGVEGLDRTQLKLVANPRTEYYSTQLDTQSYSEYLSAEEEFYSSELDLDFPSSVSKRFPKLSNTELSVPSPEAFSKYTSIEFISTNPSRDQLSKPSLSGPNTPSVSIEYVSDFPSLEDNPVNSATDTLSTEYTAIIEYTPTNTDSRYPFSPIFPSSDTEPTNSTVESAPSDPGTNSAEAYQRKDHSSIYPSPSYQSSDEGNYPHDSGETLTSFESFKNILESPSSDVDTPLLDSSSLTSVSEETENSDLDEIPHFPLFNKPIVLDYSGVTYQIDFPETSDPSAGAGSADFKDGGTNTLLVIVAKIVNGNNIENAKELTEKFKRKIQSKNIRRSLNCFIIFFHFFI